VSSAAAPGVIRTIRAGYFADAVSSDGTHAWVGALTNGSGVSEIKASNGTVIRTIHAVSATEAVSSDGTHVGVAGRHTVREIAASNGTVIRTITVGLYPQGVSSTANLASVSGSVLVKLRGSATFVALTVAAHVPWSGRSSTRSTAR
jgi:hypothetical protein